MTYTAYTSPNGLFGTVKELSFKLTVDDSGLLAPPRSSPTWCWRRSSMARPMAARTKARISSLVSVLVAVASESDRSDESGAQPQ